MASKKELKTFISQLQNNNCIYSTIFTDILNIKINKDSIGDLETLIDLLEMHEESLKQTRRLLMLKQQTYLLGYMAAHAKNWIEE